MVEFTQSEMDMLRAITSANKREALSWLIYMGAYPNDTERDKVLALIAKLDRLRHDARKPGNADVLAYLKKINPGCDIAEE